MKVCSFESRRRDEMAAMISKQGGEPFVAPSMREVPLSDHTHAFEFARWLAAGEIGIVIFMTGVGAKTLLEAIATKHDREEIVRLLGQVTTVVRGPKPTAVLREWKIPIDHRAPEPNTWRELLGLFDSSGIDLSGQVVAVQEYGKPNEAFYEELKKRGAEVRPVPVYAWALPEETGPLEEAVRRTIAGEFDIVMITSAQQIENVLDMADRMGLKDEYLAALQRCFIASIGPTASEAIRSHGLPVAMEPSHPKMGHLVVESLQTFARPQR